MSDIVKAIPHFPKFQRGVIVDPRFFVNRDEQLTLARKALFRDKMNILITGSYGIGKSSLLRKIMDEAINQNSPKVFPVWLNMEIFRIGSFNSFLRELMERICTSIATNIYKMNYSEFLEDLNKHPDLTQLADERRRSLFRIFRLIRGKRYDSTRESIREAGVDTIFVGKAIDSTKISYQIDDISGSEFLLFVDELKQILNNAGYDSILAFCDEANRISEDINVAILQSYFEIFASKEIQFIFVTVPRTGERIPEISNAFGCQIKVGKFPNSDCVEELLQVILNDFENNGGTPIPFNNNCYKKIYEVCDGHPLYIQRLCAVIYETAMMKDLQKIDLEFVTNCSLKFLKEYRRS